MNTNSNGSGSAINELSKSKSRYQHQDLLLLGFMHMPNSTAKEVAAEYHDWKYERYGDSPKRAADLASEKLGYIALGDNRQCRRSGKDAHTYTITDKGVEHLRKVGLLSTTAAVSKSVDRVDDYMPTVARAGFACMRAAMSGKA
jgi:hypothetical protein